MIAADSMYQIRDSETAWKSCLDDLERQIGTAAATLASMLFKIYDESFDAMSRTEIEKHFIRENIEISTTSGRIFWRALNYFENNPEWPTSMKEFIDSVE